MFKRFRKALGRALGQNAGQSGGRHGGTEPPTLRFAGIDLPLSEATQHFLLLGSSGSGKTTLLRHLLQTMLPRIGSGSDYGPARALIYDAKCDFLPIFSAFCDRKRIRTLNPFDERGVAWDVARDVAGEPAAAVQLAVTLMPPAPESQPFFSEASRALAYGVMTSFMRSGLDWSLGDLLRALSNAQQLRRILERHAESAQFVDAYFGSDKLLGDIMATISSKVLALQPIAACWDAASERISIREWLAGESILLLGNYETARTPMDAINRCIFRRVCDLALSQPETPKVTTALVIDELGEAGKLDGIVSVLVKGRSKGISAVISSQTVGGLKDATKYGPHETEVLMGQIGSKFIGRIDDPETAEFASRLVGDHEILRYTKSETSTRGKSDSKSTTWNEQFSIQRAVLPAEFMTLPPCNATSGISGYVLLRLANAFKLHIPGHELFGPALIPPASDVPAFVPRDVNLQYLKPWTDEQLARFCPPIAQTPVETQSFGEERHVPEQVELDFLDGLDDL